MPVELHQPERADEGGGAGHLDAVLIFSVIGLVYLGLGLVAYSE